MEETGLENELLVSNEALPYEEERTYTMILHDETGDNAVSLYGNTGQDEQDLSWEPTQVTAAELADIYEGSTNLQNTFGSFDTYMAYIEESSEMIEAQDWFNAEGIDNRGTGEIIGEGEDFGGIDVRNDDDNRQSDGMARQGAYAAWMNSEENQALMQKYGIPTEEFTNEKGDRFRWTGTGFARVYKENRTNVGDYVQMAAIAAMGIAVAPLAGGLTGALTNAGLSPALASAASSSIMNMATQMVTTGEIDIGQALLSAAGAYFQEAGMGGLLGDSQVGQALTDATDFVQEKVSSFQDLISTGSSVADAAIQAGGMNMLTSFVASGEVNLESALLSAITAGASTAVQEQSMQELLEAGGITSEDEFEAFLSEQDELQQAAIDADVKDPFLNPNYVTIGDGLMQNADGEVFNYAGDNLGNMSDLDVDGDGVLNANDLEFVEATGEYIPVTGPGPQQTELTYSELNNYFTQDGQAYDGRVTFNGTSYVGEDGQIIQQFEDSIINDEGGLHAYFEDGQWHNGDGSVISEPSVIDAYTNMADPSGSMSAVQVYDQNGNLISFGNTPLADNFEDGQFVGSVFGTDGQRYEMGADGILRPTGEVADPGAVSDYFYDPQNNVLYANEENTLVNEIELPDDVEEVEEVEEQDPDNPSDPVDNPDDRLTGGESGVGDNGAANENEYVEDTNVNDSTVVDLNNQLINDNSTDDQTASQNPNDATDNSTENQEENQEEVTEEVTDTGEVVDSNGEVVTDTGATANQGNRTNQILGLLSSSMATASGQNGETTSTGTEDNTEVDGTGNVTDETTIGDGTPGDGGTDSTETGPGDDTTGVGDPGIDDGTGGTGPGGDGNGGGGLLAGGGDFTPKWGQLFKYTDITPAQAKKMAPMYDYIKQTKGMLS